MFVDSLSVSLTLRVGPTTLSFVAGAVKRLTVDLTRVGFTAELVVEVDSEREDDPLIAAFATRDLIEIRLSLESVEADPSGDERTPLVLAGVVTDKSLVEVVAEARVGRPVIGRRYRLRAYDLAQATWRQHYPTELHARATLRSVLEAHRTGGLALTLAWPLVDEERPVIALGLGRDDHGASFYDFVLWLVDTHGGVLEYDSAANAYRIAAKKSTVPTAVELRADDVAGVDISPGMPPRAELRVLNGTTSGARELIARSTSIAGVREDVLVATTVPAQLARHAEWTKASHRARGERLTVHFARYPRTTHRPGLSAAFDAEASPAALTAMRRYRVVAMHIDATQTHAAEGEFPAEPSDAHAAYRMRVHSVLEPPGDLALDLPPYTPPRYPFRVEGKVVGGGGPDGARTWAISEDSKTAQLFQLVDVPLFNQKVRVPFDAGTLPGNFFFPPYKGQLVVLSLRFDEARIDRFIDWADEARTPLDAQGQAIALGKQQTDGTLLSHGYASQKPVLEVVRTLDGDVQKLSLTEGTITFDVRETAVSAVLVPTYDVTPNVLAAKSQIETAVTGSIEDVTSSFSGALGGVTAKLDETTAALDGALTAFESALTVRVATTRAELEALTDALRASAAELEAAASEAKDQIRAAVLR